MGTISTYLPEELEEDLEAYIESERLDRSSAIRKLLEERLAEWQIERALEDLAAGTITFSQAAEMAGVDSWKLATLVADRDISWVGDEKLKADLDEF